MDQEYVFALVTKLLLHHILTILAARSTNLKNQHLNIDAILERIRIHIPLCFENKTTKTGS